MITCLKSLFGYELAANPDPIPLYFDVGLTVGFFILVFFKLVPYLFEHFRKDSEQMQKQKNDLLLQLLEMMNQQNRAAKEEQEKQRKILQEMEKNLLHLSRAADRMLRLLEERK